MTEPSPPCDEHFLAAVGMQQHQVGPRLHRHRLRDVGAEPLVHLVARRGRRRT